MSMGKNQSSGGGSRVWGGQGSYLKSLYGRGNELSKMFAGYGQQAHGNITEALTPEGYASVIKDVAAPLFQQNKQNSIAGMSLGNSRQGVADAQVGNQMGAQYMQQLPQLLNLGMMTGGYAPLMMQKQLLGPPTVLGNSQQSNGWNMGLF